jgi:hypothetical protein
MLLVDLEEVNNNNRPPFYFDPFKYNIMNLQINGTVDIRIYAKRKWNSTQIEISEGEEYELTAIGEWRDFTSKTDAEGYTNLYMQLFDSVKRSKEHKWFALIGSLNQSQDEYFLIGKKNKLSFNTSGSLYCFANDVNGFYWNNFGFVTLQITRIK